MGAELSPAAHIREGSPNHISHCLPCRGGKQGCWQESGAKHAGHALAHYEIREYCQSTSKVQAFVLQDLRAWRQRDACSDRWH